MNELIFLVMVFCIQWVLIKSSTMEWKCKEGIGESIVFITKNTILKIIKFFASLLFSFLLQFLDYYMMIFKLFLYIEIDADRLETPSLISMKSRDTKRLELGHGWNTMKEIHFELPYYSFMIVGAHGCSQLVVNDS